jgi:ubiquinone/menaquinone biosynthesis C-methylase UbiE
VEAVHEPSGAEILLTVIIGRLAGSTYSNYVNALGLSGGERVLDFGSGSGTPAVYLASILEKGGGELVCMDVSSKWQDVCRRRLQGQQNVTFRLGDIGSLGFADASFDVVFSHFAFHELPSAEQPGTARHFSRILRAGGKVFLREPVQFTDPAFVRGIFAATGLRETSSRTAHIRSQGEVWEAVFENTNS